MINEHSASWVYSYKPRGVDPVSGRRPGSRHIKIGTACEAGGGGGTHSLDEARAAAIALKAAVLRGSDPRKEDEARRALAEANARAAKPSNYLLDDFRRSILVRGRGERHADQEAMQVRIALELMHASDLPPSVIGKKLVLEMLERTSAGTRRARLGALDRFLRWCVDREHLSTVATAAIDKQARPAGPPTRDRWLTLAELARVWRAAEELQQPVLRDLVQFLIAVPARRDEAASLEWEQIDAPGVFDRRRVTQVEPEAREPRWHQPSTRTKNAMPHDVPLNRHSLEILARRWTATEGKGLVFPAPRSGGIFVGWSNLKEQLDERSGVATWRLHDLRRTFASWVAEHGVSDTVADLLLNHVQSATRGGVLGVYQRGGRWKERVNAMAIWSAVIETALTTPA